MTGGKSETCLLSVNEGDVKLILINVERKKRGRAGTHPTGSVLMMWGSCRKHSNADKANMCFAFSSKASIF